jgi:hypothetical protein
MSIRIVIDITTYLFVVAITCDVFLTCVYTQWSSNGLNIGEGGRGGVLFTLPIMFESFLFINITGPPSPGLPLIWELLVMSLYIVLHLQAWVHTRGVGGGASSQIFSIGMCPPKDPLFCRCWTLKDPCFESQWHWKPPFMCLSGTERLPDPKIGQRPPFLVMKGTGRPPFSVTKALKYPQFSVAGDTERPPVLKQS